MRKGFWLIPTLLIVIGIAFLLFVGLGLGFMTFGMPMMMPMMMGNGYFPLSLWVIPMGLILLAIAIFAYWMVRGRKIGFHQCEHCGRKVEQEWKVCPYCGHPQS